MSTQRSLPDRPHLDHLKNEAKALLAAARRGDPGIAERIRATLGHRPLRQLADAQRALAREYGFRTWAALRAYVLAQGSAPSSAAGPASLQPLTSRTHVVIGIARGIAAAHGHNDLSGLHIALGILREAENPAVAAIYRAGVSLRSLRVQLEAALASSGTALATPTDLVSLPVTPGETALLARARVEATERGIPFVASEHLLLAMLRIPDGRAYDIFAQSGLSYELTASHLEVVLAGG